MALSLTLSLAAALTAASAPAVNTAKHNLANAATAGLRLENLVRAESEVVAEVSRGAFPGAALAIGRRDQVVVERGIGRTGWGVHEDAVDPDRTVYDLASLTKVVATTTAVMLLVEDGRMSLDDPVGRYLPSWGYGRKGQATIRHLLTHTAGLPAGASVWAPNPEAVLARAIEVPLMAAPGERVEYSDIGAVVLWAAAEEAAGEPLPRLLERRVYSPLGMRSTTFVPGGGCSRCAPTSRDNGTGLNRGRVHDPIARQLGGVAGNAGLFSTAHDLARFAAMLANGGELGGVRIFRASTVHTFSQRQLGAKTRALGWDTSTPDQGSYGHTGFTGTSIWIDTARGSWSVLLANRVYEPRAENRIQVLRRSVRRWVTLATDWSLG